VVFGLS